MSRTFPILLTDPVSSCGRRSAFGGVNVSRYRRQSVAALMFLGLEQEGHFEGGEDDARSCAMLASQG